MTPYALLFTLAAIGISEAVYLIRKRFEGKQPVCLLGETCHLVLESKYNHLLGFHNDILGLAFYIVLSIATALVVINFNHLLWLGLAVKILISCGAIMSLTLIYIQGLLIKAWCFWCLMSALTVGLMGVVIVAGKIF